MKKIRNIFWIFVFLSFRLFAECWYVNDLGRGEYDDNDD